MLLYEREYKKTANCIGWVLCLFLVMINGLSLVAAFVTEPLSEVLIYEVYDIISSLLSAAAYVVSFVVPALIIRALLKKRGLLQPMIKLGTGSFTPSALLLVPIAIAIIKVAAVINSLLLTIFGVSEVYSELVGLTTEAYSAYEVVLLVISTVLVPAFVEEILFRGAVLANLKPYGKMAAVVGSAVLFGLMHQNYYQLLYATIAGLVLGYAYIKTGSIWCPILIHFCNNLFSTVQQVIYANCEETVATVITVIMNLLIMLLGAVCFAVYVIKEMKKKKLKYRSGSFGRLLYEAPSYSEKPMEANASFKGFLSSGMVVFTVLSLILATAMLVSMMLISMGVS